MTPFFSVITPVHKRKPEILQQAKQSLVQQTCQDFEWVVVPNHDAIGMDFDYGTSRVIPMTGPQTSSVGAIKKFAFSHGRGQYLVELDWDDVLVPTALETLKTRILHSVQPDFLFSNAAYFTGDYEPAPRFSVDHGWQWRPFTYRTPSGRVVTLDETRSFPVSPASLLWIYYAPDHVRVWRRAFYHQLGGHNPEMTLADDQELILRTYLANGRIEHIDECLYLYRVGDNTCFGERNAEVQQMTKQNYRTYVERVALKWASDASLAAIDLGASPHGPRAGYVTVDQSQPCDIQANLDHEWPFDDHSVGVVRAYDFLEHLKDKQYAMEEIHRVLAPGGFLLSLTPSALGQGGACDPTHYSQWVRRSFLYYTQAETAVYIRNRDIRFLTHCLHEGYPTPWHEQEDLKYVTFEAQALKPGFHPPGLITFPEVHA